MKTDWKNIDIRALAGIVSAKLKAKGIDALLVGGACVSIYTKNKYLSLDLDYVTYSSIKEVAPALENLGFYRQKGRHFMREDCPFFIEFVSPPPAIGNEPVKTIAHIKTRHGTIALFTPTDCVKDRLAAFYHWNDPQAIEQALMVIKVQKVDMREVKRWSLKEGHEEKYEIFKKRLKQL